jgi:hypothetical protein
MFTFTHKIIITCLHNFMLTFEGLLAANPSSAHIARASDMVFTDLSRTSTKRSPPPAVASPVT